MSESDWKKIEFKDFIAEFGIQIVINNAPSILFSKKDTEHEAFRSLIGFLLVSGGLLIYVAVSLMLSSFYFSLIPFIVVLLVGGVLDGILFLNYLHSNVNIKPIECWIEIHKGKRSEDDKGYYCFTYYPIFSGKCHPNKAKNVILKLYQEQILKSKTQVTQIEVYLEIDEVKKTFEKKIGFFFQNGEGKAFKTENVMENKWKYFPEVRAQNENYIATANWYHQYEFRRDLELDFDKLHEYAPWVIQSWNAENLKPLNDEFKERVFWVKRGIDSDPKLKPWFGELNQQVYENKNYFRDLRWTGKAIKDILGEDSKPEDLRDIKGDLMEFKKYFSELEI
ncbi:MAG: hypothetical protein ACOC1P_06420 [Minisyncoccales bacterium]